MEPEDLEEEFEEFEEIDEEDGLDPVDPPEDLDLDNQPPAKQPSRSQARIEALDREAKEAKAEAELLRRQMNELLQGTQRSDAERINRERQAQLEAMDPWDRAEALNRDREARIEQRLGAVTRTLQDSTDRAEFAAKCASNARLAKIADEVERRLADARSRGVDVQRETLAAYILGEQLLKSGGKAKARAEKKAADNISRERSRPAGGSSDAPRPEGKDEAAARAKRLESYRF